MDNMVIKRISWGSCEQNKYYVAQVGGMNHNLSFSIATDKLIYKHDDKIVIKSELMADKSITNSKITCNISLSNKFNEQFFLYDDRKHGDDKPEDGIYGNYFYTKQFDCQGGPYEISISAVNNDTKLSQYFDLKYPFQRMKQKTVYVEPENPPMFIFGKIVRIGNTTIIVRDKFGNMHSVRLTDKQDLERIFIGCRVNLAVQNYQDYTSGKLLDWELRK